ncbi:hypothetical protein HZ994_17575 [Akkermansiaceae bacterium]|nr:hypothetical protein HZ994_17575 [Akkermansiaceae bacterium]
MMFSKEPDWVGRGLVLGLCILTGACAEMGEDSAKPAVAEHKGLQERLTEGGGYIQDANGQWVPRSDKRSQYDSKGESPYFKGKLEKESYKTGDYAKKTWWGGKDYQTKGYEGNTDASRFQTKARQDGMTARDSGKGARESGIFKTNTLDGKSARETGASAVSRPADAETEFRRGVFQAPSVIGWREQRSMSMERSKGILGR